MRTRKEVRKTKREKKKERKERRHSRDRKKERKERKDKRRDRKEHIKIKHPGSLKRFGYSLKESAKARHKALKKAARKYGKKSVDEKLGALKAFYRHHPKDREKVEQDEKALQSK